MYYIKYTHKADIHWTFEADISSENNPDQKVKIIRIKINMTVLRMLLSCFCTKEMFHVKQFLQYL